MAFNPEYQTRFDDGMLVATRYPFHRRAGHRISDYFHDFNPPHFCYKLVAWIYVLTVIWGFYMVLPLPGHWNSDKLPENASIFSQDYTNYFDIFKVSSTCHPRAPDLYLPALDAITTNGTIPHCSTRHDLLTGISRGEMTGSDAQHWVQGCHYHWYSIEEICMILARFDAILFVGDSSLQSIYNGFNVLLRQDLVRGALATWDMPGAVRSQCRCDNQFTNPTCLEYAVTSSEQVPVLTTSSGPGGLYLCDRSTFDAFLEVNNSPVPDDVMSRFNALVSRGRRTAIVYGFSPDSFPPEYVVPALSAFKRAASRSLPEAPMLWIGPGATGMREPVNADRDSEIWAFDNYVTNGAKVNGYDVLNMWNVTAHGWSMEGPRSAEKLAVTQAMMVINWLGRLEFS